MGEFCIKRKKRHNPTDYLVSVQIVPYNKKALWEGKGSISVYGTGVEFF